LLADIGGDVGIAQGKKSAMAIAVDNGASIQNLKQSQCFMRAWCMLFHCRIFGCEDL
jgi:hypothetical protein